MVIYLHLSELKEVFIVCYDMNLLAYTLQEMAPDDETVNNDQHFLVINLIVLFRRVELLAVESD